MNPKIGLINRESAKKPGPERPFRWARTPTTAAPKK